jgi:hypothetical protein
MRTLLLGITLFFLTAFLQARPINQEIPNKFLIRHQAKSIVKTFYVESHDLPIGKVIKEARNEEVFFHFLDDFEKLVAYATTTLSKEEIEIVVYSADKVKLGTILRETFSFRPLKYTVLDAEKRPLAYGEMNWLGTRFNLVYSDNRYKECAVFSRPYFRMMNDYWHVKAAEPCVIDPRILVILATFQSDIDTKHGELK